MTKDRMEGAGRSEATGVPPEATAVREIPDQVGDDTKKQVGMIEEMCWNGD